MHINVHTHRYIHIHAYTYQIFYKYMHVKEAIYLLQYHTYKIQANSYRYMYI